MGRLILPLDQANTPNHTVLLQAGHVVALISEGSVVLTLNHQEAAAGQGRATAIMETACRAWLTRWGKREKLEVS